jgi:NAD-dependent dihydropyrimidine dehydrogenase PreA subunit
MAQSSSSLGQPGKACGRILEQIRTRGRIPAVKTARPKARSPKPAASSYSASTDLLIKFSVRATGIFDTGEIETDMAYVIAEPCIGTKDSACVDACPVDCIHPKKDEPGFEGADQLFIDPVECIDCGACVPVCPVSAIFALDDLPEKWKAYTDKNAKHFGR